MEEKIKGLSFQSICLMRAYHHKNNFKKYTDAFLGVCEQAQLHFLSTLTDSQKDIRGSRSSLSLFLTVHKTKLSHGSLQTTS